MIINSSVQIEAIHHKPRLLLEQPISIEQRSHGGGLLQQHSQWGARKDGRHWEMWHYHKKSDIWIGTVLQKQGQLIMYKCLSIIANVWFWLSFFMQVHILYIFHLLSHHVYATTVFHLQLDDDVLKINNCYECICVIISWIVNSVMINSNCSQLGIFLAKLHHTICPTLQCKNSVIISYWLIAGGRRNFEMFSLGR